MMESFFLLMDFLVLVVDEGHRALHLVFKLLQMVMAHQSYKKFQ